MGADVSDDAKYPLNKWELHGSQTLLQTCANAYKVPK